MCSYAHVTRVGGRCRDHACACNRRRKEECSLVFTNFVV
ncbi:hypothetical protein Rhow_000088 [Rhodococcus wratislaviensis]|uniref:Uncharacterized protein n=1 Tax=Rhodococcus wratislaviensis TaxID=44752 RepID=A0A402BXW7_RHOWR|nr:hypothetical protein Rhow_000088 [Rhodococcus wratislaviensis]